MERFVARFVCLSVLGLVWSLGPANINIEANPPVASLVYSFASSKHEAVIHFTCPYPTMPQYPTTWEWTFTGCEAEPASSTDPGPMVTVHKPGTVTAEVTVTWWDGQQWIEDEHQGVAYVIGGPIKITAEDRKQQREERTGLCPGFQPNILEYFDYNLLAGVPRDAQEINKLKGEVHPSFTSQPGGTVYSWGVSGPIAFFGSSTGTIARVFATAASTRGGASISLTFSFTLNDITYYAADTSDKFYGAPLGVPDPGYRAISCHRPKEVIEYNKQNDVTAIGPPAWSFADRYYMRLWSWIGDPFAEVSVQERFPNGVPTQFDNGQAFTKPFQWNGNQTPITVWITVETGPKPPGYDYSGNFDDFDWIGFLNWQSQVARPLSGGVAVLTFTHVYHAATTNPISGHSVPVGTYIAKCYTDGTTHIKQ